MESDLERVKKLAESVPTSTITREDVTDIIKKYMNNPINVYVSEVVKKAIEHRLVQDVMNIQKQSVSVTDVYGEVITNISQRINEEKGYNVLTPSVKSESVDISEDIDLLDDDEAVEYITDRLTELNEENILKIIKTEDDKYKITTAIQEKEASDFDYIINTLNNFRDRLSNLDDMVKNK